jgi:SAM-dependent methyltransferase
MSTHRDPTKPGFWDERFRENFTPWDAGAAPPDLERYLSSARGGGRVLIPGSGSAYEVRSFCERGYETIAIDFSEAAVERARALLGEWRDAVVLGDFFAYDFGAPFDVIYERAFLASLPPRMRGDYARRVAQLLRPGGRLLGFFVHGEPQRGPPFCLKEGELLELLGGDFDKTAEAAVTASIPVFEGKERWEIWVRKGD